MFCRAVPYEGKEPYIFISYCHADQERVYPLIEQISLDGYRTWYDVGNKPGLNWLQNIEEHLENCKMMIAFISKHSSDSDNCNKEIVYGMKCHKKIIPILIEDTALPRGLRIQMVDLHYLERKNFPTDKELLKKCYESEECKACKDPSGSIPLRPAESVPPQKTSRKNPFGGIMDSLRPVSIHRKPNEKKEEPVKSERDMDSSPHKSKEVSQEDTTLTPDRDVTHREPTDVHDPMEDTVVPRFAQSGEETVRGMDPQEVTVVNRHGLELSDDKTVRSTRNFAILLHPAEQKAYKLKNPKITVGRSPIRCDVAIEGNDSISKVHAYIRQTRQTCYIEDANSANGTYIHGEQIAPGQQIALENPAVFQLNDETLILLSGTLARKFDKRSSIALLVNEEATAVRIMDSDTLPLNRNNKWPDGTLSDNKIHRAGHALLSQREDGVYLVDESPEAGNGTYLNGSRMRHGDVKLLSSGDHIRLGDTILEFVSIEIPL